MSVLACASERSPRALELHVVVGAALVLLRGDAAQQDDDVFQLQIQHEDGHRELGDSRGHLVRTLARDDVLDAHCDPQEHVHVCGYLCDGGSLSFFY